MVLLFLSGWLFWTIFAIWAIIFVFFVEDTRGQAKLGWPTSLLLITFGLLWWLVPDFRASFHNVTWWDVTVKTFVYLCTGVLWSFFKWLRLVKRTAAYHKADLANATNKEQLFAERMPKVSNNKEQIGSWIFFWPFSILRYILGDLLVNVRDAIIDFFTRIYDSITRRFYKM